MSNTAKQKLSKNTRLPPFAIMTPSGPVNCENALIKGYDNETDNYYIENNETKLRLPKNTLESIFKASSKSSLKAEFQNPDVIQSEPSSSIVFNQTVLPEFSLLTQHGMKNYKDMKVQKYDSSQDQYILSNDNTTISVSSSSFAEIITPKRFETSFSKTTPEYEKLIDTQYKDYFKQRENTATNFRHNFSIYCRKESNSLVDAIRISQELYRRMSKEEQKKTKQLMQQLKKDDETMTQCLMRFYLEAVKEVPLNEKYIRENRPNSVIARPFYDTNSTIGTLVDKDLSLKIGDYVENLTFTVNNPFSKKKERIHEPLSIISSSTEGNMILLMNKDKSYYQIPRDEFLSQYRKNIQHQNKAEIKFSRRNSFEIER